MTRLKQKNSKAYARERENESTCVTSAQL